MGERELRIDAIGNTVDSVSRPSVTALYDAQCEVCQAGVSWIRALDRAGTVDCVTLDVDRLHEHHAELDVDECLRVLHVVTDDGEVRAGWDAVVAIAEVIPAVRPLVWIDRNRFMRRLACRVYDFVATNRYQLSKCRGGVCGVEDPADTKRQASLAVFWTCYNLGLVFRLPLVVWRLVRNQTRHVVTHARTFRRRVDLLDCKLSILFLGGAPTDAVPLLFGERFCALVYRGVLIDPGSSKMRPSLRRHLQQWAEPIVAVTATHHHEEHVGNLQWAAEQVDASVHVGPATRRLLSPATRIPRMRRWFIGQPPDLDGDVVELGDSLEADGVRLDVIKAAGHCSDHVVFWDPDERVLLVGDSFMGAYFSSPNPDVDSLAWIETLDRLIALRPEVMVEGHAHVHTLRSDIDDLPGVVIRTDPVDALREKRRMLCWVRDQVEAGLNEGLQIRAIEASCFPWGQPWSWENVFADETARLMTGGEFSRSEFLRSFQRNDRDALPQVVGLRMAVDDLATMESPETDRDLSRA